MKYLNLLTFLLPVLYNAPIHAQTTSNPEGFSVIKYNFTTKQTDKPIPFDRPFLLEVENIDARNVVSIEVYEAEYRDGHRQLKTDTLIRNVRRSNPDITWQVKGDKDRIRLFFPALSPNKQFNILLIGNLSAVNIKRSLALNRLFRVTPPSFNAAGTITGPRRLLDAFQELYDSVNNNPFTPQHIVYTVTSIDDYYARGYATSLFNYIDLQSNSSYQLPSYPTLTDISGLAALFPPPFNPFKHIHLLEKVVVESTSGDISKGLRPINYNSTQEPSSEYSFEERIQNLSSSIQFFDTLYNITNELLASGRSVAPLMTTIRNCLNGLIYNKAFLENNLKEITENANVAPEAKWLSGTTESKDLQTKGSSILTLDAGFANIFAWDMFNRARYIPKLYWGLNIHFRGVDKNVKLRDLPRRIQGNEQADSNIVSRRDPLQHFSLTVGLTLGDMSNGQFGDFFNKSALLVGPSFRFANAYHIGAGVALLRRTDENPLKSQKKIICGAYVSISLDIDVLKAVDKITGILFK